MRLLTHGGSKHMGCYDIGIVTALLWQALPGWHKVLNYIGMSIF
jgi:hypothetical protein